MAGQASDKSKGGPTFRYIRYAAYAVVLVILAIYAPGKIMRKLAIVHYNKGLQLASQKKYAEAIDEYLQAYKWDPNLPDLKDALRDTAQDAGDAAESAAHFKDGVAIFEKVRKIMPDDVDLLLGEVRLLVFANELDKAEQLLDEAQKKGVGADDKLVIVFRSQIAARRRRLAAEPYLQKAAQKTKEGKPEEALVIIEDVKKKFPGSPIWSRTEMAAYLKLVELALEKGDEAALKKALDRAVAAESKTTQLVVLEGPSGGTPICHAKPDALYYTMAVLAYRAGDMDMACKYAELSVEKGEEADAATLLKELEVKGFYHPEKRAKGGAQRKATGGTGGGER